MMLSKNGVALIVLALSLVGIEVSDTELLNTISVVGQVVAFILMAWNQYAREDVHNFLFKGRDDE
jgi:hypothetical protein